MSQQCLPAAVLPARMPGTSWEAGHAGVSNAAVQLEHPVTRTMLGTWVLIRSVITSHSYCYAAVAIVCVWVTALPCKYCCSFCGPAFAHAHGRSPVLTHGSASPLGFAQTVEGAAA